MSPPNTQDDQEYQDYLEYQEYTKGWNVVDAAKHYGSGAVRGLTGTLGLAADVGSLLTGRVPVMQGQSFFPNSELISSAVEPYLTPKDRDYRYSEMMGEFTGPGVAARGVSALRSSASPLMEALKQFGSTKNIALDSVSAMGAQGLSDVTGENTISPLVGALVARGGASAVGEGLESIARRYTPRSDEQVYQTAASLLQDYTKLTPDDIQSALKSMPEDELLKFKSTAEVTQNAPMAQLQQQLTGVDDGAAELARRTVARRAAQEAIVDRGSSVAAVNPEGLGSELIKKAEGVNEQMGKAAHALWKKYPREVPVYVGQQQSALYDILSERQAGLDPGSKVAELASQFMNDGNDTLTSGALQNLREDSMALLRDANLRPHEQRILATIRDGADAAVLNGARTDVYRDWIAARDATALQKQTFGRTAAGGSLINPDVRPSYVVANSFKGDSQGVKELKAAIGDTPELLEKYKRGVLDLIKTDKNERLTTNNLKKYLEANEGGLIELLGKRHYDDMRMVLKDMQSADSVGELASLASKGSSPTAQRFQTAGALSKLLTQKIMPGLGPLGEVAQEIQTALGDDVGRKVNALLLRAAMEPEFAAVLAGAPTQQRIMTGLEYLKRAVGNIAGSATRGGILGLLGSRGVSQDQRPARASGASGKSPPRYARSHLSMFAPYAGVLPGDR